MLTISARIFRFRLAPLAAATSAALAVASTAVFAGPSIPVQNCHDTGPGSLRDVVENIAHSGDVVDLGTLPSACGTADSVITLTTEIGITQDDLTLRGPKPGQGSVTIDGGHATRVLRHTGIGTLHIDRLDIANGLYDGSVFAPSPSGGCIASAGNVAVHQSSVAGCVVETDFNYARGGGIFADGVVTLINSSVSGNQALATVAHGWGMGGGVYASVLNAINSTLSNNKASSFDICGQGGGALIKRDTSIVSSTIDNNEARCGSAIEVLWASTVDIPESTVSMNVGGQIGAVRIEGADSARVSNSTIVLNQVDGPLSAGSGLYFRGTYQNSILTLQSSIVANNEADIENAAPDVFVNTGVLAGNDNLVIRANVPLQGIAVVQADPVIGPLAFNGGPTRTHALLRGSPAIGAGNNVAGFEFDQRGIGFPRTSGASPNTDIGAFESDSIFADDFES